MYTNKQIIEIMRLKAKTKDVFILSVFVVGHIGSAYHRVRITASPPC